MAGVWRNAMSYLGLGPDEDYDDFEPEREPVDSAPPRPQRVRPQGPPPGGQPVRRPVAPLQPEYGYEPEPAPVSYTHLTLPTSDLV